MIKKILITVVLFFIFIGSAECKKPVPHTKNNYFYPVADTYVYEKSNTVSVKELELRVGNQNTNKLGNIKSALRFDISEIPGNSIINEAHLSVYSFNAEPSWGARPIQAYPAQQTWSETSIDWIQINDINVQTFDSTFIAGIPGSSPDTYSWDITNIVQSWVNGEINCGVVLQSNAKIFNNYIIICSSNNLLFKPFLNISYTLSESTSLDLKLPGKTNSSKLNDPMDVENIAKTDKINETISESSVIAADHIPLNDTSPDMIQTAAKAILPEITKHPQSQVKNPGLPVNFLVTVSGTPPLFFQWQKDGMDIEGENSKSVTIDSVALNDKGFYSCNVSNDAGSVKSNDAELLLNLPVRIIKHPLSQSITNKKPVTFTVTAEGKAPWSYQWKKNHINILGATSKNFTIESVKKKDEGVYACEVSNDFSNDISDDARLIVIHPPKITHQPQSQVKNPGTPAIFNVTVSAPLLSFQWLKDGVTIDGATSETFTIDAVSKKDAGAYTCNVFNDAGSVVSNGAELFVNKMAAILKQPISQSIVYEKPVTFSLTTAGKPPLSYQWKKDHINIPGAISNSYTIKSVQKKDEGIYTCEVSNNFSNDISHDAMLVIFYPPEITSHPSSQTNDPDTSATFSVTASGTPPFSYQWMKDKTVISNAVADSYTIDSVSEKDEGTFTCTITNAAGTQTSEPAILSVNDPVQITKQPFPQSKKSGEPVTFSVTAVGTLPLSFQWEKDSLDILGATEKSYTIDSVQKSDVGLYTCEIHNGFSNDISNDIILVVKNPPEILLHPLSQIKNPKMPVTFSITASGTPPFAFQWMKDGIAIDKAVTDSFIIDSVSKADEGTFTCTVTNDAGNMISNPAVLSVNDPVQITQHPQSQLQKTGMPVTFSVTASGSLPLLFQWQRDGVNIDGATSQNFTIDSISKNDEGYFSCKVSNDAESVNSDEAELLINVPPEIKQHPQSQLINPGSLVTFSVHASGVPPLLFQWQRDGVDIDGATSGKYTIGSVSLKNEGFYSCSVRNDAGYVISDEAELFLNATPASDAVSTAPESAKPATDKISKRSCNQTASADSSQKPTKTMKIKPSAPTGLSEEKKSAGARLTKQQLFAFKHLSLNAPAGQGAYVHNGNTLTFNGTAFPNATLVSARLEDHQGYLIRNISKRLKFDRETGNISGSIFVGSFRGAEAVHLKINVKGSSNSQTVSGTSNTLFIDQGPPKVRVTQPANHARFNTSPIVIYGTASDDISGIAAVEISIDGGATYRNANMIRNHQWLFSFTPKTPDTEYTIKVRSTDIVGLSTISDNLTIHYSSPLPPIKKIKKMPEIKSSAKINGNTGKSPKDDGICTYRIINLNNNNFQPTDLFTLNEQMAIIVKGYGGKVVTVRIINPSIKKVIFEFSDYIPAHKSKMWKWELSQTGAFQAALFVDGNYEDQISFTIIQ